MKGFKFLRNLDHLLLPWSILIEAISLRISGSFSPFDKGTIKSYAFYDLGLSRYISSNLLLFQFVSLQVHILLFYLSSIIQFELFHTNNMII